MHQAISNIVFDLFVAIQKKSLKNLYVQVENFKE